jgi:hypothetical protein
MVRKRHFLHHILKKSYFHTIIALVLMKLLKNTQTNYALNAFTPYRLKNMKKSTFFPIFPIFRLWSQSHIYIPYSHHIT